MTADDKFNDHTEYTDLALSAAQDGEDRLRDTLDKVPAGAYICDPDGLITYYNQHALRLWGRAPRLHDFEDRFCGSFKLFTPDGLPVRHDQCWMAFALKSKKGYNGQEILIERPDGHRLPVLAYANPIRDSAGKLLGAVNVLVDISDRKQTEENLRKSRDAAVASSRAKDHFLAVLSHELRTPLSPVVMSIAALENDPNLPPDFHEEIVMIRRNLDLHMALLDDLLDVSRVISGKVRLTMQPVHVHEKLRHVIHNCQSEKSAKKLNLEADLSATNDGVMADPARLQQVFWNLIRNAIKFTPEGGSILVRTWNQPDGEFCAEVRDSGVGIAPDALPRIFDPFEQAELATTRQYGGLGLGLSIARSVVEMHGGSIVAASDGLDHGASFTVRLKTAATTSASRSATKQPGADKSADVKCRVLVVEDHADTAAMMARLLQTAGYEVQTAHSVASALEKSEAAHFDVIVSDIGLPDATGYDLMSQVKGRHGIKGIALSGYGMEDDIRRSSAAGFDEHLVKPVNFAQLQSAIQRLSGR